MKKYKPKYRITKVNIAEDNFVVTYLLERLIFGWFYFPVGSTRGMAYAVKRDILRYWRENLKAVDVD